MQLVDYERNIVAYFTHAQGRNEARMHKDWHG